MDKGETMSTYIMDLLEELRNMDFEIEWIERFHNLRPDWTERGCHEARALILADIRQYYGI
jgi:hypothetical protein